MAPKITEKGRAYAEKLRNDPNFDFKDMTDEEILAASRFISTGGAGVKITFPDRDTDTIKEK